MDILFVVGLLIVLVETMRLRGPPNPSIIFAGLALMGLPVVSRGSGNGDKPKGDK